MRPSLVSFCSGCGGMDLGFSRAGFHIEYAFDADSDAIDTYNFNLGKAGNLLDIKAFDGKVDDFRGIDGVICGAPCQGFSTVGKNDPADPRNEILRLAVEYAIRLNPSFIVIENVPALAGPRHNWRFAKIQTRLVESGYSTTHGIIDANSVGVPQARKRLILVASKNTSLSQLLSRISNNPGGCLSDALDSVAISNDPADKAVQLDGRQLEIAMAIKPGQKLSNVRGGPRSIHTWDIPQVFGPVSAKEIEILEYIRLTRRRARVRDFGDADPISIDMLITSIGHGASKYIDSLVRKKYLKQTNDFIDLYYTFNGKYRRLRWDKPSSTVDTRFGDPILFLHPSEHRGFSLQEAARIQGFPDKFKFSGARSSRFRQVGNAVPPELARTIATQILNVCFQRKRKVL